MYSIQNGPLSITDISDISGSAENTEQIMSPSPKLPKPFDPKNNLVEKSKGVCYWPQAHQWW